jgi:hypothetical protein
MRTYLTSALGLLLLPLAGCQEAIGPTAGPADGGPSPAPAVGEDTVALAGALAAYEIGSPIVHGNLAVFPVIAREERSDDRFTTLDEGLRDGTVKVFETGAAQDDAPAQDPDAEPAQQPVAADPEDANSDEPVVANVPPELASDDLPTREDVAADYDQGRVPSPDPTQPGQPEPDFDALLQLVEQATVEGDVNRLMVVNSSGKPLYLMPGEIIVGGKQDRCIARETIVPPGDEPVAIEAYCVEHGRWSGRGMAENTELLARLDTPSVVSVVPGGYEADLSLVISQTQDQPESLVAEEEEELAALAREADDGQFVASAGPLSKDGRRAAQKGEGQGRIWDEVAKANLDSGNEVESGAFTHNYTDEEIVARLAPYQDALDEEVSGQERVVGAIVAINGKVEAADVFESTPLFRKLWPKLLKGHALDAVAAADGEGADTKASLADAKAFVQTASETQVDQTVAGEGLVVTNRTADGIDSFSAGEAGGEADGAIGGGGGFGGGVHSAAFAQ